MKSKKKKELKRIWKKKFAKNQWNVQRHYYLKWKQLNGLLKQNAIRTVLD